MYFCSKMNFKNYLFQLFVLIRFSLIISGASVKSKKTLLIFAVATEKTDGHLLYLRSLKTYGLKLQNIMAKGMDYSSHSIKVNLLTNELKKYKDRDDIIVLFTDSYDVLFTAGEKEILRSFVALNASIVFSAETNCSPDPKLARFFPEVKRGYRFLNSGGIIGYAPYLYEMMQGYVGETMDDQLYYTYAYLNESSRASLGIALDTQATIFQSLHNAADHVSFIYNDDDTKLFNHYTNTTPSIIHGNGDSAKYLLHTMSSYLVKSWSKTRGCLSCDEGVMDLANVEESNYPKVLMGIFIERPSPFLKEKLERISNLIYPKNRIFLFVFNKIPMHEETAVHWFNNERSAFVDSTFVSSSELDLTVGEVRDMSIKTCLNISCDLLFSVDSEVVIENPNTLKLLIERKRNAIAPIMTEPNTFKSTFWSALTENFTYAENFDYKDIITNKRRGIWNIPQIRHIYVIWRINLDNVKFSSELSTSLTHPDVTISRVIKKPKFASMFLHAINLDYYGHLTNMESDITRHLHPDLWEVATNSKDWERKYLLQQNPDDQPVNKMICQDVFLFPLFTKQFCLEMIETSKNSYKKRSKKRTRDGYENLSTNSEVVNLKEFGFHEVWGHIVRQYVIPIAETVFPGYISKGESKDNYIVSYSAGLKSNQSNIDDDRATQKYDAYDIQHGSATYIISVALNQKNADFQGGGTRFLRYNCSVAEIPIGWVMINPGSLTHSHEELEVTNGTRYSIVSLIDPTEKVYLA